MGCGVNSIKEGKPNDPKQFHDINEKEKEKSKN
jgi:hypothetical protein